ncbi:hypothetical protein AAHB66_08175 [Leclercia sp. S52]|uniref:hypothetical protein n=1 Tax=Leclercia sp. S52 TaxID=3138178 RepID=UPI00321AA4B8
MKIIGVAVLAGLLAACSYIHPFGDATEYQSYSVSSHPGLGGALSLHTQRFVV